MLGHDSSIQLTPITEAEARAVALWRYPEPYDFYDGRDSEVEVMLDPANGYFAVHADREFVGYVCVGPDALVAGQQSAPDVDDVGVGFRPDLTGRSLASSWLPAVLDALAPHLTAPLQRVVIAEWNQRSQAVARACGFGEPVTHSNDAGDWIVMTRRVRADDGPDSRPPQALRER